MITQERFVKTTINKLCASETSQQLISTFLDARNGWKTANGETRGGFARLGLRQEQIETIKNIFNKLFILLSEKEKLNGGN